MSAQPPLKPAPPTWFAVPVVFVLLVIGCVGPWVTSDLPGVEAGGLDKDGSLVLVLGVVALALLLVWRGRGGIGWSIGAGVCGLLGVIITVLDLGDFDDIEGLADPGWGLYLSLIASVLLVAVSALLTFTKRS